MNFFLSKSKKNEWYEVEDPLVFQNGKLTIVEASKQDRYIMQRLRLFAVLPFMIFSGYKLAMAVMGLRLGGSLIWGLLTTLSYRLYSGLNQNKNFTLFHKSQIF